jgi:hypothetical protein
VIAVGQNRFASRQQDLVSCPVDLIVLAIGDVGESVGGDHFRADCARVEDTVVGSDHLVLHGATKLFSGVDAAWNHRMAVNRSGRGYRFAAGTDGEGRTAEVWGRDARSRLFPARDDRANRGNEQDQRDKSRSDASPVSLASLARVGSRAAGDCWIHGRLRFLSATYVPRQGLLETPARSVARCRSTQRG